MGTENASNSNSDGDGTANFNTQIVLNVYDLTPINHYTAWFGFGIFHSGIEGEQILIPNLDLIPNIYMYVCIYMFMCSDLDLFRLFR